MRAIYFALVAAGGSTCIRPCLSHDLRRAATVKYSAAQPLEGLVIIEWVAQAEPLRPCLGRSGVSISIITCHSFSRSERSIGICPES